MKKTIIPLIAFVATVLLYSCSGNWIGEPLSAQSKKVAAKLYNERAIPSGFNKTHGTLLVASDIKGEKAQEQLETIMNDYQGKYQVVSASEVNASNTNKSDYVLHINSRKSIDANSSNMKYTALYVSFYLTDAKTAEKFEHPFVSSKNWSLNLKFFLDKLNERLRVKA